MTAQDLSDAQGADVPAQALTTKPRKRRRGPAQAHPKPLGIRWWRTRTMVCGHQGRVFCRPRRPWREVMSSDGTITRERDPKPTEQDADALADHLAATTMCNGCTRAASLPDSPAHPTEGA